MAGYRITVTSSASDQPALNRTTVLRRSCDRARVRNFQNVPPCPAERGDMFHNMFVSGLGDQERQGFPSFGPLVWALDSHQKESPPNRGRVQNVHTTNHHVCLGPPLFGSPPRRAVGRGGKRLKSPCEQDPILTRVKKRKAHRTKPNQTKLLGRRLWRLERRVLIIGGSRPDP
jgi:hypothetical protein